MAGNRCRHDREVVNKPATVESGDGAFDATLQDISESGAGVSFSLGRDQGQLDIGRSVALTPDGETARPGRVVRHYEGGFGMVFTGGEDNEA